MEQATWCLVEGHIPAQDAALLVEASVSIADLRQVLTDLLTAMVRVARKAGAHDVASSATVAALAIAGVPLPLIAMADGGDA